MLRRAISKSLNKYWIESTIERFTAGLLYWLPDCSSVPGLPLPSVTVRKCYRLSFRVLFHLKIIIIKIKKNFAQGQHENLISCRSIFTLTADEWLFGDWGGRNRVSCTWTLLNNRQQLTVWNLSSLHCGELSNINHLSC